MLKFWCSVALGCIIKSVESSSVPSQAEFCAACQKPKPAELGSHFRPASLLKQADTTTASIVSQLLFR